MNIILKALSIKNFKGIKDLSIQFGKRTSISGENATGKTTVFDAVTWLLFNKNSLGNEKFEIRPLDENGKTVDFVEINVSAEFENAETGESFTLDKTQKQKWTKHTGDENATFTGNVNEYGVNGFPKSEKEYKAFISELIDEEHFKLLSSPTYFTSLPWKKQREILMSLVSEESDLDFAKRVGGFDLLIPELELAPKTTDIVEKWKRTKKELDTKHKEFPVRIDELSRNKVNEDVTSLTALKEELELKIASANDTDSATKLAELSNELTELKLAKTSMENDAKKSYLDKRAEYDNRKRNFEVAKANAEVDIRRAEIEVKSADEQIIRYNDMLADLGSQYHDVHNAQFDETPYVWNADAEVCPTCKRPLPAEDVERAKKSLADVRATAYAKFSTDKSSKENHLIEKGNEIKALAPKAQEEKKKAEQALETAKVALANAEKDLAELGTWNMAEPNLTGKKDYDYLVEQIAEKETVIANVQNAPKVDTTALKIELNGINERIAKVNANASIDARIEELKAEQKETSQKIATAEGMLFTLDKFIKAKLESVSASINGKFKMVNFKLFNALISGAIEETCSATYNGVPFESLNNGMKICGGLDIINTLSEEFGKTVFVFVDNAESINEYKIVETKGQLITLSVTDSKELKVESK